MTVRREVTAVLAGLLLAGAVLLVREPALGLAVGAGTGAGAFLRPGPRTALAGGVALLGLGVVTLGVGRADVLLVVCGAVVTTAAGLAAVRSRRWPPPRRGPAGESARGPTARDTGESLDRGEDPTR